MMKRLTALLLTLVAATSLGACSTATEPTGTPAYTVTRSWSNGMEEQAVVYADGRTIMTHEEHSERVTLPADQMATLAAAAALEIPAGANSDDPIIGVTIGAGAPIRPAGLTKDSLPELLNRLLDSHTLNP
jgi:ABC-type Fe3+-hydroxamate transport system substrate-binding protein